MLKLVVSFLFTVGLLLTSCERSLASDHTVEFKSLENDTPIALVYVNGTGPYIFALDTAATYTEITVETALKSGVSLNDQTRLITSINGDVESRVGNNVRLTFTDASTQLGGDVIVSENLMIRDADGILGVSHMKGSRLTHEAGTDLITLNYSDGECVESLRCAPKIYEDFSAYIPGIRMYYGDHSFTTYLDTGYSHLSPVIMFPGDHSAKLWNLNVSKDKLFSLNAISGKPLIGLTLPDTKFAGVSSCQLDVIVFDPSDTIKRPLSEGGVVGWELLRKHDFIIDFQRHQKARTYLKTESCLANQKTRFGIEDIGLTAEGNDFIITSLRPASPAYIAGLRSGDSVLEFQIGGGNIIDTFEHGADIAKLAYLSVGEVVQFKVSREGQVLNIGPIKYIDTQTIIPE